mmetsp:Transcript_16081/g.41623  ORF Transcript_16081/g.41623 Transcript_16081/m.41623 type:complete len:126 (-) Transcript_16081:291-668(-)
MSDGTCVRHIPTHHWSRAAAAGSPLMNDVSHQLLHSSALTRRRRHRPKATCAHNPGAARNCHRELHTYQSVFAEFSALAPMIDVGRMRPVAHGGRQLSLYLGESLPRVASYCAFTRSSCSMASTE